MTFAYPYIFAFPVLLLFFRFINQPKKSQIEFPNTEMLSKLPISLKQRLQRPILNILSLIFLISLSIAAARPQKISFLEQANLARDLVLAIDVSGSMETPDFESNGRATSRLVAVKKVLREFVEQRQGDRLGLVVFGSNAFLQAPLTFDHNVISNMIERLEVGMAGQNTAIGEGIGLSLKRLAEINGDSRAIILLTDGQNTSGSVNPLQAANIARDLKIKIHTIGIGSSGMTMRQGFFGMTQSKADYDEVTLKEIANKTGGVFFNASNLEGLQQVYQQIDQLERREDQQTAAQSIEELFFPYAQVALISYLFYIILIQTIFRKLP